jgi:hypothetical protein
MYAAARRFYVLTLRCPIRAPKPYLCPSPEFLGSRQSVALLSASEDHALPALFHTVAHNAYELAGSLTYYSLLAQGVVTERDDAMRAHRPHRRISDYLPWSRDSGAEDGGPQLGLSLCAPGDLVTPTRDGRRRTPAIRTITSGVSGMYPWIASGERPASIGGAPAGPCVPDVPS